MGLLLFVILALISIACFLESETVERRWLKLTLSLCLSILIPFIMSGRLHSIVLNGMIVYFTVYIVLPTIAFSIFQLLFYNIKLLSD